MRTKANTAHLSHHSDIRTAFDQLEPVTAEWNDRGELQEAMIYPMSAGKEGA